MSRDEYTGIPDYGQEQPPPNRWARVFPGLRTARSDLGTEYIERLRYYFSVFGVAFLVIGIICIVLPLLFSSISVQQMVAWILVIGGVAALLHFLLIFGAPGTTSFLLLGVLHLAIGLWMLFQSRVRHASTFVWLVMAWLFVHGVVKLLMGYELRSLKLWPALTITGFISVALGILNIVLTPTYGLRFLGVLFGGDLAVTGLAFLIASFTAFLSSRASATGDPLLEGTA